MNSNPQEVLERVVPEVLENLAFMFADPAEDDQPPTQEIDYLEAHMGFSGMMAGTIRLIVPAVMCSEIAANMLGLDPDDEDAETGAHDAVKEVLNVICGHVLTELVGEEPVFDLTVPSVSAFDLSGWADKAKAPGTALLSVDDNPVLAQMTIEQSA